MSQSIEPTPDRAKLIEAATSIGLSEAQAARLTDAYFGLPRPSAADLLGIAPDWCGGLSVDEFLEQSRGEA